MKYSLNVVWGNDTRSLSAFLVRPTAEEAVEAFEVLRQSWKDIHGIELSDDHCKIYEQQPGFEHLPCDESSSLGNGKRLYYNRSAREKHFKEWAKTIFPNDAEAAEKNVRFNMAILDRFKN